MIVYSSAQDWLSNLCSMQLLTLNPQILLPHRAYVNKSSSCPAPQKQHGIQRQVQGKCGGGGGGGGNCPPFLLAGA